MINAYFEFKDSRMGKKTCLSWGKGIGDAQGMSRLRRNVQEVQEKV